MTSSDQGTETRGVLAEQFVSRLAPAQTGLAAPRAPDLAVENSGWTQTKTASAAGVFRGGRRALVCALRAPLDSAWRPARAGCWAVSTPSHTRAMAASTEQAPAAAAASGAPSTLIIDGKATAATIRMELKERADALKAKVGKSPGLAVILVGARPDSATYVRMKRKACEEVRSAGRQRRCLPMWACRLRLSPPSHV